MLIPILTLPDDHGVRQPAVVDDSTLQLYHGHVDTDHEQVDIYEYCLRGCPDPIHQTPRTVYAWCPRHVHRSVHVTVMEWPEGLGAEIGTFF